MKASFNASEVIDRIEAGAAVSDDEYLAVTQSLRDRSDDHDPYTLLLILGLGFRFDQRRLVEEFLDDPADSMLTALALEILCEWWGDTAHYLGIARKFAQGVQWDEEDDVRVQAISVLGRYCATTFDRGALGDLLALAESHERDLIREFAIEALAVALGIDWLNAAARGPSDSPWSQQVVQQARRKLETG